MGSLVQPGTGGDVLSPSVGDTTSADPTGYHRTVKAHFGSHLYGGPQGWNPHSCSRVRGNPGHRAPATTSSTSNTRLGGGVAGEARRPPPLFALLRRCHVYLSVLSASRHEDRSHVIHSLGRDWRGLYKQLPLSTFSLSDTGRCRNSGPLPVPIWGINLVSQR